jgi:DNA replication and repair protein RecF
VYLSSLIIQNFRNYQELEISFHGRGAVFIGKNGAGKSNLLEAIHMLCTGRSHRGAQKKNMIRNGVDMAYTQGKFNETTDVCSDVRIGFTSSNRFNIQINGTKLKSFSEWFGRERVVPFGPPDMLLILGRPSDRRRFVNMVLSQADGEYLERLISYRCNLMNRNALLCSGDSGVELDVYEERMAKDGGYILMKRKRFFSDITGLFTGYFKEIHNHECRAGIFYAPSIDEGFSTETEASSLLAAALEKRRQKDFQRGYSSVGPHRDDFLCLLDDGRASLYASHGQCRSLSICLRLCAVSYLQGAGETKGVLLLIDDAFCELDGERTARIFSILENKGQIFLTSTSPSVPYESGLQGFEVRNGTCVAT